MAGPVIKPKANRHDSHFEYKHLHKGRCLFTYLLCLSVSFLSPSSVDQQHNTTQPSALSSGKTTTTQNPHSHSVRFPFPNPPLIHHSLSVSYFFLFQPFEFRCHTNNMRFTVSFLRTCIIAFSDLVRFFFMLFFFNCKVLLHWA